MQVGELILDEIGAWKEVEDEAGDMALSRLEAAKMQRLILMRALASQRWDT